MRIGFAELMNGDWGRGTTRDDEMEFGIFVFNTDDVVTIGDTTGMAVRDNVLFELGLFIGRLGRERTFIVMPKDIPDFHLPSDLLGVTAATFQPPRAPEWMQAAMGPACHKIRNAIRKQAEAKSEQGTGIQPAPLLALISEPELRHLQNLARGSTRNYEGRGSLRKELRHLRALNFISMQPDRLVGQITTNSKVDLADFVKLTDLGRQCLAGIIVP